MYFVLLLSVVHEKKNLVFDVDKKKIQYNFHGFNDFKHYSDVVEKSSETYGVSKKLYIRYKKNKHTYGTSFPNKQYEFKENSQVYLLNELEPLTIVQNTLSRSSDIEFVSYSYYVPVNYWYNDPFLIVDTSKTIINIYEAWKYASGNNTKIIIVDSGIDFTHNDLIADPNVKGDSWKDVYPYNDDGLYGQKYLGDSNHGTLCSGVSSAIRNNFIGSCGTSPKSSLVSIKVGNTHIQSDRVRYSLLKYKDYNAVYSISWNINLKTVGYEDADLFHFEYLFDELLESRDKKGCILVWAAGNDKRNGYNTVQDMFTSHKINFLIGSSDSENNPTHFSRPGSALTLLAPGQNVYTTDLGNSFSFVDGTSFSAPMVAGVVSLILEIRPEFSYRDIKYILMKTATVKKNFKNDITQTENAVNTNWVRNSQGFEFNNLYGAGVLNASKALEWSKYYWYPVLPKDHVIRTQVLNNEIYISENMYSESVQLFIKKFKIGPSIVLVSPAGTKSELSPKYTNTGAYQIKDDYSILTNAFWGEHSKGVWKIEFDKNNVNELIQSTFELQISGVFDMPNELKEVIGLTDKDTDNSTPPYSPILQPDLCLNTCYWNDDSECDDGGSGSDYNSCGHGTDCLDCGKRSTKISDPPPSPPHLPPPPYSPLLPTSPSISSSEDSASIAGDPHLKLAMGGKADFRGNDKTYYNIFSDPNTNINCLIEYVDFRLNKLMVHGSVMTELHIHKKLEYGKNFTFSIYSNRTSKYNYANALITCDQKSIVLGPYNSFDCFDISSSTKHSTSVVKMSDWVFKIISMDVYGHVLGPSKSINIEIESLNKRNKKNVHGLIGQSFTFSSKKDGKTDVYPTHGEYTTNAHAEGAIEGIPSDYIVSDKFDTNFTFKVLI